MSIYLDFDPLHDLISTLTTSVSQKFGLKALGLSKQPVTLCIHDLRSFPSTFSTMLPHSLPRTVRTSTTSSRSCMRKLPRAVRSFQSSPNQLAPTFSATHQAPTNNQSQSQSRSAHAISNPTLAGIEKRWEGMPPQEQAELWMLLRDRMKVDWQEMTLQEKKAGMFLFHDFGGEDQACTPGQVVLRFD